MAQKIAATLPAAKTGRKYKLNNPCARCEAIRAAAWRALKFGVRS